MTNHEPRRIQVIANELQFDDGDYEPSGWFKAKLTGTRLANSAVRRAKYVLVTATSPTPLGEGKTVTAIGLAMGLRKIGRTSLVTLREPSMGPLFGVKGGGAGGGNATLLPSDDINLHFTGDFHAVSAAANLLAALADNHALRSLPPLLDPHSVEWRRAIDVCDRGLAQVHTHAQLGARSLSAETGFVLTPASEVMAILALATSWADLRTRLGRIVVGRGPDRQFVSADDIRAAGALAALLKDALRPNLVQTCEHTPAFVHAGPFANIAHGNSSVIADQIAVGLTDYVVTEAGFGADCGAEKFFHVKCRISGLQPDAVVLVTTLRALKLQCGRWESKPGRDLPRELAAPDPEALRFGAVNLAAHLDILRQFGPPVVVAINRFPSDVDQEIALVERLALDRGAVRVAVSEAFARGGEGSIDLARAVEDACAYATPLRWLYPLNMPPGEKIRTLATRIYGATDVDFSASAQTQLADLSQTAAARLPLCVAKTPYSLSHDPRQFGRPTGFRLPIRSVHWAAGAGYVYAVAGDISTMPGLPAEPRACRVDLTPGGQITGLDS